MLARSPQPANLICLHLTGDVRIRRVDGADLTPRSRKGLALIALLALTPGHSAGRDRILGLLWGDRGEEQARASLRQTIVDLKTTAPDVGALLNSTRQAVALQGAWHSDTGDVDAALASNDPAQLLPHLQAMRGELLQSLQGLTDAYDDWLLAERAQRRDQLISAALAMAQRTGTEFETGRQLATALLALDPGNEDVCRLGMRLDKAAGDLASLHRRFRVLEEQLAREFDAKPSPETAKLLRELTAVQPAAIAPAGRPRDPSSPAKAEPPLLLVTPLAPLDDSREAQSVGLILSEELETTLARYRELRVLSSARPDPQRLEAIVGQSFATYMLGGSVRGGAAGTRVNIRLSDVPTGRVVWSRRVEIAAGELGTAVDELVDQVVGAVLPALQRDLVASVPTSANDYSFYYGGVEQLFAQPSYDRLKLAADLFEKALAINSSNVPALLRLAYLYNTDFHVTVAGHNHIPWRAKAYELVRTAVQIDPVDAQATCQLGWCHLRAGAWDAAAASLERAITLAPYYAEMIEICSVAYLHLGDINKADELMQRAFYLNPLPSSDYFADSAIIETLKGNFDRAVWYFGEVDDGRMHYQAVRVAATACSGDTAKAKQLLLALLQQLSSSWFGTGQPTFSDLLEWVTIWLPLRNSEHCQLLTRGLTLANAAS